jgi:hypothetical protein
MPSDRSADADDPLIPGYWDWVAVAMFLLVTVDLLTTLLAAAAYGVGAESNPLVEWLLGRPLWLVVTVNLVVVVLATAFFHALHEMVEATPAPYDRYFARGVEGWLGLLVAAGLFVFANNVSAIVHGASLL